MKPLRVVLVTRGFWPLVGGAEVVMANLAGEFLRLGARPTVVTAQWEKAWPKSLVFAEVPVVRLAQPARRGWGTLRYMVALGRWLRHHSGSIDVVYVSMLKHDAYVAVGALRGTTIPVVLRAEGGGSVGDCHWQTRSNIRRRIRARCQQADAFVAISSYIEAEMIEAEYPRTLIRRINNGVGEAPSRDPQSQAHARRTLAKASSQMALPRDARLAVYTGRLHEAKGLDDLLSAWTLVHQRWPAAHLWMVGSGSYGPQLEQRVKALGLQHRISFPGVLDSIVDILDAADLFILPSLQEGMSIALLEAMSYAMPIIATDIPGNRELVASDQTALLVRPQDPEDLARAICRLWDAPKLAQRLGETAKQRARTEFSLTRVATQHLDLFNRLIQEKMNNPG